MYDRSDRKRTLSFKYTETKDVFKFVVRKQCIDTTDLNHNLLFKMYVHSPEELVSIFLLEK